MSIEERGKQQIMRASEASVWLQKPKQTERHLKDKLKRVGSLLVEMHLLYDSSVAAVYVTVCVCARERLRQLLCGY